MDIDTLASLAAEVSKLEKTANDAAGNTEKLTDLYLISYQDIHQRAVSLVEVLLDDAENLDKILTVTDRLEILKTKHFQKIETDLQGFSEGVQRPIRRSGGPKVTNDLIQFDDAPAVRIQDCLFAPETTELPFKYQYFFQFLRSVFPFLDCPCFHVSARVFSVLLLSSADTLSSPSFLLSALLFLGYFCSICAIGAITKFTALAV